MPSYTTFHGDFKNISRKKDDCGVCGFEGYSKLAHLNSGSGLSALNRQKPSPADAGHACITERGSSCCIYCMDQSIPEGKNL